MVRDYIRWNFTTDEDFNWLEKGTDTRQTGEFDDNCNPKPPKVTAVNQNVSATYKLEDNVLKITAGNVDDNEETTWSFNLVSPTEFTVTADVVDSRFTMRFVKQ